MPAPNPQGSNGTKTQRKPAANDQLKYTSTLRQAAHWHRVRLGPFSAFSDAEASISMASI